MLYPDEHPDRHPDVLASTERGLDLGKHLSEQGHELVTTSDTGDELDAQLTDAEIVITTPFWPLYLGRDRIEAAENLKLVITAGYEGARWTVAKSGVVPTPSRRRLGPVGAESGRAHGRRPDGPQTSPLAPLGIRESVWPRAALGTRDLIGLPEGVVMERFSQGRTFSSRPGSSSASGDKRL